MNTAKSVPPSKPNNSVKLYAGFFNKLIGKNGILLGAILRSTLMKVHRLIAATTIRAKMKYL